MGQLLLLLCQAASWIGQCQHRRLSFIMVWGLLFRLVLAGKGSRSLYAKYVSF